MAPTTPIAEASPRGTDTIDESTALLPARSATPLFAGLLAGAYALMLADLALDGALAQSWVAVAVGALLVLGGILVFPIVERRRQWWLTCAYFATQLSLGVLAFGQGSVIGGTFLLLVIVGQSVRVLPPWGTLALGAPLPLLHVGMAWPEVLREGATFLVALGFLFALSQALVKAERARAALDVANQELRAYAAQREELATTRERNRIAREIHDSLGHYLTTIHMQIQASRSILETDRLRADQTLAQAQQLTHEALDDVRRSVAALRADRLPLPDALAELARTAEGTGLATTLDVFGTARPLAPGRELALYRAAQEALTNAHKHAAAASATLTLDFTDPARVRLTVADDGQGAAAPEGGFGLVGLRERVQLTGGALQVKTAPGAGMTLVVEVPG